MPYRLQYGIFRKRFLEKIVRDKINKTKNKNGRRKNINILGFKEEIVRKEEENFLEISFSLFIKCKQLKELN